jgi:hypothetical protein
MGTAVLARLCKQKSRASNEIPLSSALARLVGYRDALHGLGNPTISTRYRFKSRWSFSSAVGAKEILLKCGT